MDIVQSQVNNTTVITIKGDVGLDTSPKLRQVLLDLVKKKTPQIVISFQDVAYIDSSGLATLIEAVKLLKKDKGEMILVGMSDKIKSIFKITRLDKLFAIYKTQEEAAGKKS